MGASKIRASAMRASQLRKVKGAAWRGRRGSCLAAAASRGPGNGPAAAGPTAGGGSAAPAASGATSTAAASPVAPVACPAATGAARSAASGSAASGPDVGAVWATAGRPTASGSSSTAASDAGPACSSAGGSIAATAAATQFVPALHSAGGWNRMCRLAHPLLVQPEHWSAEHSSTASGRREPLARLKQRSERRRQRSERRRQRRPPQAWLVRSHHTHLLHCCNKADWEALELCRLGGGPAAARRRESLEEARHKRCGSA